MKVLSYNTLFGGFDGMKRERYEAQIGLIQQLQPDVLLLQEAKNFQQNGYALLLETEHWLGMRGFLGIAPHTGQNTAIFIVPTIRPLQIETDDVHFHHARLTLTAEVPGFAQPITFISVHLAPNSAEIRLRETAYLLNEGAPDKLVLVGGDFNTICHHDPVPADLAKLTPHYRLRYTGFDGKAPDSRPLQFLESAGWIELGHQAQAHHEFTVPTTGFKGTEFAHFRSDYFLASASLNKHFKRYQVIKNDITNKASDHYPILAEFT